MSAVLSNICWVRRGFAGSVGMSQQWWGYQVLELNPLSRRGSKFLALQGSGAWLEKPSPLQRFGKPCPVSRFGKQVCTSADEALSCERLLCAGPSFVSVTQA